VVPKAKGMAARLEQEAEAYQQKVVAGRRGCLRFKQVLSEYNKAPKVMRDRLYLDMMQQVMSATSKVIVDQKGGNSLLYLPLDKLTQAATSAASNGASVAAAAAAAPVAPPAGNKNGRDFGRSRDILGGER
jgi:membrane protease subunit HflK